jgi:hypothetical protein
VKYALSIVLVLFGTVASAAIVELPRTQQVALILDAIAAVAKARGLNAEEAYQARVEALLWLHVGPCVGSTHGLAKTHDTGPRLFLAQPSSFDSKPTVAAREMVTILMGRSLGRMKYADGSRDDVLCDVAKEMTADPIKR